MAAALELVPADQDHVLCSRNIVRDITHQSTHRVYRTYEFPSEELIHLAKKPKAVWTGRKREMLLQERTAPSDAEGWSWQPLAGRHGVLLLRHDKNAHVTIER